MKTLKELREEHLELLDEAQAITNLAEKEGGRQLSEAEANRWSEIMRQPEESNAADKGGLAAQKLAECDAQKKLEHERKTLALQRQHAIASDNPISNGTIEDGRQSLNDRIKDANPSHVISRLRAFRGDLTWKDAKHCGMYLKAATAQMRNRRDEKAEQYIDALGWQVHNSANESSAAAGGYLVPDPLASAIINYRILSGVSRRACRVVPMTADTLDLPKKTGTHTVYYVGEGDPATGSQQTFGRVNLVCKKRGVLSQVSQELRDDALVPIVDDIVAEMGSDLAIKEDAELILGDGTSTYGGEVGLLSAIGAGGVSTAAMGHDTWPEIDLADVMAWLGLLPSKFAVGGNTAILCSANFYYSVLCRVALQLGGTTHEALLGGVGDGADGRFWGKPVYFTDHMPTASAAATVHALYGDFGKAVAIGDRMGIAIGQSDQYAFANQLLTILAVARYDINVHEPGTASAAGAYVGLKSAA